MSIRAFWSAAVLSLLLAASPALGMELRNLRTDPAEPGVGQPFRVVFEPKVKWHESEACKLLLQVDDERERDRSRWPYIHLQSGSLAQWQGYDWRVWNREWPRDGKEATFEWRFFTPGRHSIRFEAAESGCELSGPVTLTVDIKPRYDALSWVMVAPRGTVVTQALNEQLVFTNRDREARFFYDEDIEKDWRLAFAAQNPKSWDEVMDHVRDRLRKQHGAKSVDANPRTGDIASLIDGRAYLLIFTRQRYEALQPRLTAANYVPLLEMDADRVAAYYAEAKAAAQAAAERVARQTRDVIEALPTAAGRITAMKRSGVAKGEARVCSRQYSGVEAGLVDAYNHGAAFKTWAGTGRGFDDISRDLNQLYTDFVRGRCTALVMTAADAAQVVAGAQREKLAFEMLDLRDEASLLPQYQEAKGFKTLAEARMGLVLQPLLRARDAERMSRLGVDEAAKAEQARARMRDTGYAKDGDWSVVAQFLEDEDAGRRKGGGAVAARKAREAQEAAQAAVEREKSLKAYPYSVTVSCSHGPFQAVPVYLCLVGSTSHSTLELKNCGNWRTVSVDELMGDRVRFALCPSFMIRARNSSEFVLSASLKDERSGKELDRQSAVRFRWISMAR